MSLSSSTNAASAHSAQDASITSAGAGATSPASTRSAFTLPVATATIASAATGGSGEVDDSPWKFDCFERSELFREAFEAIPRDCMGINFIREGVVFHRHDSEPGLVSYTSRGFMAGYPHMAFTRRSEPDELFSGGTISYVDNTVSRSTIIPTPAPIPGEMTKPDAHRYHTGCLTTSGVFMMNCGAVISPFNTLCYGNCVLNGYWLFIYNDDGGVVIDLRNGKCRGVDYDSDFARKSHYGPEVFTLNTGEIITHVGRNLILHYKGKKYPSMVSDIGKWLRRLRSDESGSKCRTCGTRPCSCSISHMEWC